MAQFAIMLGGAVVNALEFTKARAQLQIDKEKWAEKRAELADLASKELHRQGHVQQTFKHVDEAFDLYHIKQMLIFRPL